MKPDELHKVHAAHSVTAKSMRIDVAGVTWRGENGPAELKRATALRFAVAWNICAGISTENLLDGVLMRRNEAVAELLELIDNSRHYGDWGEFLATLKHAAEKVKRENDRVGFGVVQCAQCDEKENDDAEGERAAEER